MKIDISAEIGYQIEVDINLSNELKRISRNHPRILLIVSETVKDIHSKKLDEIDINHVRFLVVPDGEYSKSIETLEAIWQKLGEENFTRSDAIVAIGGGATTDVAGFAAATWLRGISWYAFPSTLAGAVDAAIGGKTGINSHFGKNLIGSFYSPRYVGIDLDLISTITQRDLNAGMAEVIKTGFIGDKEILNILESNPQIQVSNLTSNTTSSARDTMAQLIFLSSQVKARFVSADFKEGKLREALNYGHTLGHAVERYSIYKLRHGEAVSIGLYFAAKLSSKYLGLKKELVELHDKLLVKYELDTTLNNSSIFPNRDLNREKLISDFIGFMKIDKKSRGDQIRFVGIRDVEKIDWIENLDENQISDLLGECFFE